MRYLSVCSGIEAATMAWHPLGWSPVAFSEIEKFPSAVLAHHYPHVPNRGDMTKFEEWPDDAIDLLVGGTPCQSFSVAGLRKGLADPRGNLMLTYLAIAARYRPSWLVWENVPGALSVDGGSAFASLIRGMAELGYHASWRVLDAQYIVVDGYSRAVPQRRNRVFVVGHLGDWRRAAAVFLEPESLSGNPPPRREAGKVVAPTISARSSGGGGLGTDFDCDGGLVVDDAARCVTAGYAQRLDWETENFVAHSLRAEGFDASEDGSGRGTPLVPVSFPWQQGGSMGFSTSQNLSGSLVKNQTMAVALPNVQVEPTAETMYGVSHADAAQTGPDQALRALREAVGEKAYSEWGAGVVTALRTQEVLRSEVYGSGVRRTPDQRNKLDDNALSCSEAGPAWTLREVWEAGCIGCPPSGWEPSERLCRELGAHLSLLPHSRASAARFLLGLWRTSEGLGLLREALSALQEAWQPAHREGQSAPLNWAVRRLTPTEAERLQGFPDNFTNIPWRGKPEAPDGPRYKALGNSMACNVMRFIGQRIQMIEELAPSLQSRRAA